MNHDDDAYLISRFRQIKAPKIRRVVQEIMMDTDNAIKDAVEVIEILLDIFAPLPYGWEDMVSYNKQRKVVEFMAKYSQNDSWKERLNYLNGGGT